MKKIFSGQKAVLRIARYWSRAGLII